MRLLLLVPLLLLGGCPSTENPARKAVDAAETTAPVPTAVPSTGTAPAPSAEVWTCPMHPEVVQDHPGKCPKCNMDLVKKGG